MVESSNTEFGQPNDLQKGRSLDRDRQGSMPIAGPEMNRHLRRAGYAREVGELSDVDLETTAPQSGQALVWNEDAGGDPYNPENSSEPKGAWVPGSGGGTVLVEVYNATGSTLTLGTPVYVSGTAVSGKPEVEPAQANNTSTMPAIGLVQADIAAGEEGYVVAGGTLAGPTFDTNSYPDGTPLYVDPDNAGQLVDVRPDGVNPEELVQKVALVTRQDSTVGSVVVMGAGRTNDIPNALGRLIDLGLTADETRLIGNSAGLGTGIGPLEEIQIGDTMKLQSGVLQVGVGGVGTSNLDDEAVTTAKLDDGSVTTDKIADSAVTTSKLNDGGVTTDKLADSSVTTAKIADANVTAAKLATDAKASTMLAIGTLTSSIANTTVYVEWDTAAATALADANGDILIDDEDESSETADASIVNIYADGRYQIDCSFRVSGNNRVEAFCRLELDTGGGFARQSTHVATNYALRDSDQNTGTVTLSTLLSLSNGDRLRFQAEGDSDGTANLVLNGTLLRMIRHP